MTERKSLVNRYADFWLLGGLSVGVWLIMMVFDSFREWPYIKSQYANIPYTAASLALIFNYPHFLASYKLAYVQKFDNIKRAWFQLLLVPVLLIGFIGAIFYMGIGQQAEMLGILINLMFLSVGWHYSKQIYGCMMVYAKFDGYEMNAVERSLIKYSLLSVWWITAVQSNLYGGYNSFYTLSYKMLDLPDFADPLAKMFMYVSITAALGVFVRKWKMTGRWPSPNILIPMIALFVWWIPQVRQNDFYMYLTPLFHSIQYLAFVYKIETVRYGGDVAKKDFKYSVLLIGLFVSGWAAFEIIPNSLDKVLMTTQMFPFFVITFLLFINIHHYFIDNAIWRLRDPELRKSLLA